MRTLINNAIDCYSVKWSACGRYLATALQDNTARLIELSSGNSTVLWTADDEECKTIYEGFSEIQLFFLAKLISSICFL